MNATLHTLADSAPAAVAFDDLARRATERLASTLPSATVDADTLASVLLQLAAGGLVEFRALPSRFVHRGGARPKASGLARWQALRFDVVSSLGHWPHRITAMERFILPMVDGERDRGDLLREIQRAFAAGELNVSGGTPSTDQLRDIVADILESLGRGALLTA